MKITQIYQIINNITNEITGNSALVKEDLSNIVDVGKAILGATDVDKYVKTLLNHIGKVVFEDRVYNGSAPKILMDSWEYGSILEKITADMPVAVENKSWELTNGTSYSQDTFNQPVVSAKFFNSMVTFEIDLSFTELQVKQSFSNATQLNGFMSMLYNAVDKSLTVKTDGLIMRCINNMIAQTVESEIDDPANYSTTTTSMAVNLLKLYNDKFSTSLTKTNCILDKEFLRFSSYVINLYVTRLASMSELFNIENKKRFTPKNDLHVVVLNELKAGIDTYLESDTYHNDLVKLPNYEVVPFWQGSGTDFDYANTSKINVTIDKAGTPTDVSLDGILCVMFDKFACGVCNKDRRVATHYNAKAEFFNNFYKQDCEYFNDLGQNFVVFFVQ